MNIFLDAFADTNFGDDLFIHTIVKRYADHTFYMQPKKEYETAYRQLVSSYPNICLTDDADDVIFDRMDGMLIVGGDIFGSGADYSYMKERIRRIRKRGGFTAILGISLFPRYGLRSRWDLRWIFTQVDIIVVRDRETCAQLKQLAPRANVKASSDMAFTTDVSEIKKQPSEKGLLGISVRRKIQKGCDTYDTYCRSIADTAMAYLDRSEEHRVEFLALSCGVFDDRKVAADIIALCPEVYHPRMSILPFVGDVEGYIRQMQACEKMLCTRFHALVFAILLDKTFVPIVYEEKMDRLLNEIGYQGIRPKYEEMPEVDAILEALREELKGVDGQRSPHTTKWDLAEGAALAEYLTKAEGFFEETDRFLQ